MEESGFPLLGLFTFSKRQWPSGTARGLVCCRSNVEVEGNLRLCGCISSLNDARVVKHVQADKHL